MSPSQAEPHSSPRAKSHSASQAEPSQHTKLEVNPATLEPKSPGTVLRETRSLLNKMDTVMAHAGNAMDAATFKLATSMGASDDMLQSLAERQAEAKAAKRLASAETLDSTDQIPSDQIPSDFSHVTATDADMHDPDLLAALSEITGEAPPPRPEREGEPEGPGEASPPSAAGKPPGHERCKADHSAREETLSTLRGRGFLQHTAPLFMHGRAYSGPIRSSTKPKVLWKSSSKPRKDHDAASWLTATEFIDRDDVLRAKVAQLAALMRVSRHTVVYTGAGISASVVGQAALSGTNKVGWTGCKTAAMPTATHHALAALGRAGLIHGWVQQNHDGLPQKAGFPQERICEVHGSWFDPSNPVVKYSGSLKDHECEWMQREAAVADLVLVLGTSLGGLFADEVATSCAERSVAGGALGSAIINLQQTEQDGKMSLNLFSKSDDAMRLLLQALGLPALPAKPEPPLAWAKLDCALVPYNSMGKRLAPESEEPRMWLDLRPGAKVILSRQHNHQGARQPNTIHIGAAKGQKFGGKVIPNPGKGVGAVVRRDPESWAYKLNIDGAPMRLGMWWLEAAASGGPAMLPLVNQSPKYEGRDAVDLVQPEAR